MKKNWIIIILGILLIVALVVCFMLVKNGGALLPQATPTPTIEPSPTATAEPSPEPTNEAASPSNAPISNVSDDIINQALAAYEQDLKQREADSIAAGNDDGWDYTDGHALVAVNGYPLLIDFPTDVSTIEIARYDYQTGKIVDFASINKVATLIEEVEKAKDYHISLQINKEGTALRAVSKTKMLYYTLNDKQEFLFGAEISINCPSDTYFETENVNALISSSDKAVVAKYGTFPDTTMDALQITDANISSSKQDAHKLTKADITYPPFYN